MIFGLPPDPSRLATKDDLAVLRVDLRMEMSELGESLRVEMRELSSQQTRTLMMGLVLSITALAVTQIVVAALG